MNVGGIENQLMHLVRHADKERFQIDFTTTVKHPYFQDEIESLGSKCIYIPPTGRTHLLKYCRALYHVLRDGHYDIVHSNELFHSGLVLLTAKLAGVKHRYAHAHSSNQKYDFDPVRYIYFIIMRFLILHTATNYFACSSMAASFLYGDKIFRRNNYHLIVNSVDTEAFLSEQKDISISEDFFSGWKNILQVGRFSAEKNFLFTAKLAKECKKRNNGIRFLCIGNRDDANNSYENKVKAEIKLNHLEEYMILLGTRKDVAEFMKRADAFILPSQYEGMPLTLIEAQASCLPCLAADTFSHEVDFNIDAIIWMDLNDDVSLWVNSLETIIRKGKADKRKVINAIQQYGFDSKVFSEKICRFYLNDNKHYYDI